MDINEIARIAGTSRATVSRYLNNGYVSKEKRDLIARVIRETGYVPSHQARQLRTGKTNLVGVIVPSINSQAVSRMVTGITETLAARNYQVLLANTRHDTDKEVEYLRVFSERNNADGIILISAAITDGHIEVLNSLDVPVVVLGQRVRGHNCVYHDDYHASYDVTMIALQTGKYPAFIGISEQDEAVGQMRHQGFLDACAHRGITPSSDLQLEGDFSMDSGYSCCEQILDNSPTVDTIVCVTDTMAFGALTCLREYGHRVPEDIQVVGIGDSPFSRAVFPALTTVHLFYKTSGEDAAQLLLAAMGDHGQISGSRELMMGYEVYARTSTR